MTAESESGRHCLEDTSTHVLTGQTCECGLLISRKSAARVGDEVIGMLDHLLACYRIGRRPAARVLVGIGPARRRWAVLTQVEEKEEEGRSE